SVSPVASQCSAPRPYSMVYTASSPMAALSTLSASAVTSGPIPSPGISARSNALLLTPLPYLLVFFVAWEYRGGFRVRSAWCQLIVPGCIGACTGAGGFGATGGTGGCNAQGIKYVGCRVRHDRLNEWPDAADDFQGDPQNGFHPCFIGFAQHPGLLVGEVAIGIV